MKQNITIAQLKPSTKGGFSLIFEVAQVTSIPNTPDQITCTIVDETGCINAYFNNHANRIKEGSIYQLQGLRCRVVDHYLRLELIKESKLTRIKYNMTFRDLFNNLSEKFYMTKAEESKIESVSSIKSSTHQNSNPQKEKSQQYKNISKRDEKQSIKEEKDNKTIKAQEKQSISEKKEENQRDEHKVKSYQQKRKYSRDYNEDSDKKNGPKQEEKNPKKKFIEKNTSSKINYNQKRKDGDSKHRVLLKDIPQYIQRDVNLFVQVHTSTTINAQKCILVKVCDSSGSTYIQFKKRAHLQDKSWYCLRGFKVFRDHEYKFIACQQDYSTFDMLDDFNQVPEKRPIAYSDKK